MEENVDVAKKNEEIARKINKIEKNLPSFQNAKDLFDKLLLQIQEEFGIPFVWITITTETEFAGMIQALRASSIIKERLNVIDRSIFLSLTGESQSPLLINTDLKPFYKLLPRKKKFFVKSLAIAPIIVNGEIIGSINLGDYSSVRYQPGMDTGLLEKLVGNVSTCLSNLMHGAKEGSKG